MTKHSKRGPPFRPPPSPLVFVVCLEWVSLGNRAEKRAPFSHSHLGSGMLLRECRKKQVVECEKSPNMSLVFPKATNKLPGHICPDHLFEKTPRPSRRPVHKPRANQPWRVRKCSMSAQLRVQRQNSWHESQRGRSFYDSESGGFENRCLLLKAIQREHGRHAA